MGHERVKVRLLAFELERRARRMPGIFCAAGALIGALLAAFAPDKAWPALAAMTALGLLLGRDRAALLRSQTRWMLESADSRRAAGAQPGFSLRRRIAALQHAALPPLRSGVHAVRIPSGIDPATSAAR
jgi:hypothetical protein